VGVIERCVRFLDENPDVGVVGALPEEYFLFLGETDGCLRIRRAGRRVVRLPTAFAVHLSGGSSKRRNPALTRIEYHRSPYPFFRKHRGAARMATVLSVRIAKALLYVLTQMPLALAGARHRARWRVHWDVLAWHPRSHPAGIGLGRPPAPETGAAES
jgi:GT2 family glycosyltransferase